jgi:hypothetical protein
MQNPVTRALIVTACDENHYELGLDLITSLRDLGLNGAKVAFVDMGTGGAPEPLRLAEFLTAGSPPIVFTLGTAVVHGIDREFYEIAVSAVNRLDCRAVLLTGPGITPRNIPLEGGVFSTEEYVSYDTLFQKGKTGCSSWRHRNHGRGASCRSACFDHSFRL